MNPTIINQIFKAYQEGMAVTLLTGRPIYDLDTNKGKITTLVSEICNYAYHHYHMVMVRYSLATGIGINEKIYPADDVKQIKNILTDTHIMGNDCSNGQCSAGQELINILKGILHLSGGKRYLDMKWTDDNPLRFMFLFEFTSDILPEATNLNQLIASELSYISAHSVMLRDSGNYIVFNDVREGKVDEKVSNILPHTIIPYPTYEGKLDFIRTLHTQYPNVGLEQGLEDNMVANLSSNTPNRGLEGLFLGSHRNATPITTAQLIEQKVKDVSMISEGTLTVLDTARVANVNLVGETIQAPKRFLTDCALRLRRKDKLVPMNILLLGSPSTGKTDLALLVAVISNVPVYGLLSPKAGIVGETERRAMLQMNTFKAMNPNIGFIDEISEAFPMERSEANLDSGASAAVTASLLQSLADKTREGNSILIATSNCGWRIGSAMLSRFTVIPVLSPVVTDFPAIIESIAQNIVPGVNIDIADEKIIRAAQMFYQKKLMPRQIRGALKLALSMKNSLTPDNIIWAAQDAMPLDYTSHLSSIYSDYYAIHLCTSKELLPWNGNPDYPFPEYIRKILDNNGEIDSQKLNNEMNKLRPYVNI